MTISTFLLVFWFGMFVAKHFILADGVDIAFTGFDTTLRAFPFLDAHCFDSFFFP
jgi:hypothetical protein